MMNDQAVQKSPRFISLRVKLLIGFTLVFSVVFAAAYYWFYDFATDMAFRRIEEDLRDTLTGFIEGIDGDEFVTLALEAEPGAEGVPGDDPRYRRHQAWIGEVYRVEPRSIPYTFIKGQDPYEVLWIGDAFRIMRPADQTSFHESYVADPANTQLYRGFTEVTVNMDPYVDAWGNWVSAYGPIKNSQGEVVGGAGIDFRANYVREVQRAILNSMLGAFVITYTILFALVWVISRALALPITSLTAAAERIGEGDYDQDLSHLTGGTVRDEIGTLADVFQIMVAKVHQREDTLKKEVQQLRIEIDEVMRKQEVGQIVESAFFQELKSKARQMRRRSKGDHPPKPDPH